MIDEGYTKFDVRWADRSTLDCPEVVELERWRLPLFAAGLVGHYQELGIGYGNISMRSGNGREFVISGTQTGHLAHTGKAHYALVTDYDIDGNAVTCCGAVQASSESLTHAAIYELDPAIRAVVHVHSSTLWDRLRGVEPTTHADVTYGTPEMAREFKRLYGETGFAETGLAIMAGHESGIVSIGKTIRDAASRVLALHDPRVMP
ncbi:MAG: class II aldolase/adducin family protein [Woeseiaceae bacterium]